MLWIAALVFLECSQSAVILTEHALQSHKAADETVKVDIEVFISIAHGYDVI